jgi:AhpD family alkylhydroperoxidase
MNWKDHLAEASANLVSFRKAAPDSAKGFGALSQAALSEGSVTLRHKELMCIAIGISKQCDDCIGFHVKAAMLAGVSREEIVEKISVAMYMGGGPSFMYRATALDAFDQISV